MISVLYITFAYKNMDGATYSLMDLIESVKEKVHPIVLLRGKGCVYDYFTSCGIECIICDFEANLVGQPHTFRQYVGYLIRLFPKLKKYYYNNYICIKRIIPFLRQKNINIIHTNNTVISLGGILAKKLGIKHVWHLRGFMDRDFGWMPFIGWARYRTELYNADALIGITRAVLEHFVKPRGNHYIIHDAVRHKYDTCLILPKEKFFLFCAGLLLPTKGCDFAIRAFAKSHLSEQGYKLKFVGTISESYRIRLDNKIKHLGLNNHIEFLGPKTNIKEYMSMATAFMMCSENEGLGRVTVEAMFYGCPVLGRKSGGTPEIIIEGCTGYLFDSEAECASKMIKIVHSDTTEIIRNAQKFVSSNFAIEDYGKKIIHVYNQVLK